MEVTPNKGVSVKVKDEGGVKTTYSLAPGAPVLKRKDFSPQRSPPFEHKLSFYDRYHALVAKDFRFFYPRLIFAWTPFSRWNIST